MGPLFHQREPEGLARDAGSLVVSIEGGPVDHLGRLGEDAGEAFDSPPEQCLDVLGRKCLVPDADSLEQACQRVILVLVFVSTDGEYTLGRVIDRARLCGCLGLQFSVNVQPLTPSVVGADDMVPVTGFKKPG